MNEYEVCLRITEEAVTYALADSAEEAGEQAARTERAYGAEVEILSVDLVYAHSSR